MKIQEIINDYSHLDNYAIFNETKFIFFKRGCSSHVYIDNQKNILVKSKCRIKKMFLDLQGKYHIPTMSLLESKDNFNWYSMPFYSLILESDGIYNKQLFQYLVDYTKHYHLPGNIANTNNTIKTLYEIIEQKWCPATLADTFFSIAQYLKYYNIEKIIFDIHKENIAIDESNTLILLDFLYDAL